jgi:hypothetical protein
MSMSAFAMSSTGRLGASAQPFLKALGAVVTTRCHGGAMFKAALVKSAYWEVGCALQCGLLLPSLMYGRSLFKTGKQQKHQHQPCVWAAAHAVVLRARAGGGFCTAQWQI